MNNTTQDPVIMIAGATGLVGSCVLRRLLAEPAIQHIYALNRRSLSLPHPKLTELIDSELSITHWPEQQPRPQYGIIALGTTLKQAGSKHALEKVDFELVCQVAHSMKILGVTRLAIVSSYGANPSARSHYLRCKGRMEETIRRLGFDHLVFVRPGPFVGQREQPRNDEIWLQRVMRLGQFFLFGRLKNLIPIDADKVAQALLYALFDQSTKRVTVLHSVAMHDLVKKYQ
ncbi:NAD(P)H-binding protein [Vibrio metschnikovii]|uniref:NAD(P)H-binding protein n=1 Tax=Vibrio metschnikovii TaxID=28172 RepID=UPI001C2F26F7|nr:NAD(P)H-binding protein [Vibrio metschnikovii]